jgi:hypothetical protein
MSVSKKDQLFPSHYSSEIERRIANAVARALREEYGELTSAVKWIGRKTGAHPRAIKNWYEARNAPNSVHLLMLARSSATVLRVLMELIERADLAEFCERGFLEVEMHDIKWRKSARLKFYGEEYFTINVRLSSQVAPKLNQRQIWFLGILQGGLDARASDIVSTWGVTLRAAKFDIADLKQMKLIRYVGARKSGRYMYVGKT